MQSEWRREEEYLNKSRALRAATRESRAKYETSLSRHKQALTDVRGHLIRATAGVAQSYAMLAVIEKILATRFSSGLH